MKYKEKFIEHFKNFPIFRFGDAERFLMQMGASSVYARKFMSAVVGNGTAYRITNGYYTMHKDINLVGYAFRPFYYGLGTALTNHGLWEQQANQTIITTKKVREGARVFFGLNATIRRIPEGLFFGYKKERYGNFHFYISDVEKTLIDMAYYEFNVENYVYTSIFKRVSTARLESYLKRCPERVRQRVEALRRRFTTGMDDKELKDVDVSEWKMLVASGRKKNYGRKIKVL